MSWLFLILVFLTIHPISLRWFQVHPQSQVQISHFPYSKSSWFPFSNLDTSPHSLFSYHLPSYHLVQQCQWWFTLFHFYLQLSHWVSLPQLNDHIEYSSVFQCTLGGMLIPAACSLQFVSRIDENAPALERCHIFIYIPFVSSSCTHWLCDVQFHLSLHTSHKAETLLTCQYNTYHSLFRELAIVLQKKVALFAFLEQFSNSRSCLLSICWF